MKEAAKTPPEAPQKQSRRSAINYLREIMMIAVGFLTVSLMATKTWDNIKTVWHTGLLNRVGVIAMTTALAVWSLTWIGFAFFESDELGRHTSNRITPLQKILGVVAAAAIAILFGLMFASVTLIPILLLLFAAVVLGAAFGDNLVITGLEQRYVFSGRSIDSHFLRYYFYHPHMLMHCIQLFLVLIAALVYKQVATDAIQHQYWPLYSVLILSIAINDGTMWKWRLDRLKKNGTSGRRGWGRGRD